MRPGVKRRFCKASKLETMHRMPKVPSLAAVLLVLSAGALSAPAEEKSTSKGKEAPGTGKEEPKDQAAKPKKPLGIDEEYVRDKLEKYLAPAKLEFLDDGRVHVILEFAYQKEEHENIFTPKISKDPKSKFRWSLRGEYSWSWWGPTTVERPSDGTTYDYYRALRIGNDGAAHLDVWFNDDLEAEITYSQGTSSDARQTVAVIFTGSSGKSIASRFGTECAIYSGGRKGKSSGEFEAIPYRSGAKLKLVVKGGTFEAYREGKKKCSLEYGQKTFALGKLGFLWGGGVAGFIHRIEIKGRVDAKKMAAELRKRKL